MDWLAKLKDLVKINLDFRSLKSLSLINVDNSVNHEVKGNQLIINIGSLNPQESKQLKEILHDSVHINDEVLITDTAATKVEQISNFYIEQKADDSYQFVVNHIPEQDKLIWLTALFITYQYKKGSSVFDLKKDVRERFGERGANIANLCTAGYLESHIIPLFKQMSAADGFEYRDFEDAYSAIVTQTPFAIFVSHQTSEGEILDQIQERIEYSQKYGLPYVVIHGIGQNNIEKIIKAISKLQEKIKINPPEIVSAKGQIRVTVNLLSLTTTA